MSGNTFFAAVLAFAGLLACGGGGSGGGDAGAPGGGGGGGGGGVQVAPDMSAVPLSMTPDERDAAIDAVNTHWATIDTGDLATDNQLLLDYVLTRTTEFADAGISPDGMVWARFIDGLSTIFVTKTVPVGTVIPTEAAGPLEGGAGPLAQLPQGDRAVLIDVDLLAAGSLNTIAPALANKNYAVSRPAGTVDDFLAIKDVSVLFISSHGYYDVTKGGLATYAIMTNEHTAPFDPNDARKVSLRALSNAGELIVASARVRNTNGTLISVPGKFFAITSLFVQNNWQFTQNSLVVLDSCDMFLDQRLTLVAHKAPYEDFRAALTSKKAGTIVGWDGQVSPGFASNVMQLFFDRVAGANAYKPESPKQRPFPYVRVYDWLVSTGQHSEAGGGTLRLQYPQALPGQLVPTIHNANIFNPGQGSQHAGQWVLEIAGEFGTEEGVVSVNDVGLVLLEPWANDRLVAALPPSMTGPGTFGDLIVKVRDHPSNAVPLTQWTGTVSQVQIGTDIGEGARFDISCPIRGTTDVHAARSQPAGAQQRLSTVAFQMDGPCTYTLSGSWNDGTTRYDLSGSGSVSPIVPTPVVGGFASSGNSLSLPATLQGGVGLLLLAPGNLRVTDTTNGGFFDDPVNGSWAVGEGNVTLNADYSITGNRTCLGPTQCTESYSLTPLPASFPTPDTES